MGKEYLIDSNVVIGYLDGRLPENGMTFLHAVVDEVPRISVISKIEVLRFNAPKEAYKVLIDFIDSSLVYGLSDSIVARTIQLGKEHKVKLPDAVIAATALVHNLTLLTRNLSDFKNIPGLLIDNPYDK